MSGSNSALFVVIMYTDFFYYCVIVVSSDNIIIMIAQNQANCLGQPSFKKFPLVGNYCKEYVSHNRYKHVPTTR